MLVGGPRTFAGAERVKMTESRDKAEILADKVEDVELVGLRADKEWQKVMTREL